LSSYFKVAILGFCLLLLAGCFAEDYDVGVPTAHLEVNGLSIALPSSNVNWETASENVQKTEDNLEQFALMQEEITASPNQLVSVYFEENEQNGGDIFTDEEITITMEKDKKQTKLELTETNEFHMPLERGRYVLVVSFSSSAGNVEYIGNILIR